MFLGTHAVPNRTWIGSVSADVARAIQPHGSPTARVECIGRCAQSALSKGPASPHLLGPTPDAVGPGNTNWLMGDWSGEGAIAVDPYQPSHLLAAGSDGVLGAEDANATFNRSGTVGVFNSFDGGRTWTTTFLPPDPEWYDNNSALCDQLPLADNAVAFGPNGTAYLSGLTDTSGMHLGCLAHKGSVLVYVWASSNGGRTWATPVAVAATPAGTFLDKPWLAVDPRSGEVFVGYSNDTDQAQIQIVHSTDRGATWSAPLNLSVGAGVGVQLAVDRYGGLDALWEEEHTGARVQFARSLDHGTSFGPTVAPWGNGNWNIESSNPDKFRVGCLPSLTIDQFSNSYTGRLFAACSVGPGGAAGSPTIELTWSDDNGTNWSVPVQVESNRSLENFQPSVAVGTDGEVYVVWYGENATTGVYRLYGATSTDGGTSFRTQYAVSNADSLPAYVIANWTQGYQAEWIGDYTAIAASPSGDVYPMWTDARSRLTISQCRDCVPGGVGYNISLYAAGLESVRLTATIPVNVTIGGGVPGTGTLPLAHDAMGETWLSGSPFSITAPPTAVVQGSSWRFGGWFGTIVTAQTNISGVLAAPLSLIACYVPSPETTCASVGQLDVHVIPPSANLTIDAVRWVSSNGWLNLSEPSGPHWVNASASGYVPVTDLVDVSGGNTTHVNLSLEFPPGTIVGFVRPASAVVELDGAPIPVSPNGTFGITVEPGAHEISAGAYGYFSDVRHLAVPSGGTVSLTISLPPDYANLVGSIDPLGANVTLDDQPMPLASIGSFSLDLFAGTYWVNSSAPGFAPIVDQVTLTPGNVTSLSIVLAVSDGWIDGTVVPANAGLVVGGRSVLLGPNGTFNVTIHPGVFLLTASAPGFASTSQWITVGPGRTTQLRIEMDRPAIVGSAWSSTPALEAYALVGIAVVLTAGSIAMMRRRRPPKTVRDRGTLPNAR